MSDWIDRHSVTCVICGNLADERESVRLREGEAHQSCFDSGGHTHTCSTCGEEWGCVDAEEDCDLTCPLCDGTSVEA